MKKLLTTWVMVLALFAYAAAQQPFMVLSGMVTHQENGSPMAGQPMFIVVDSLNSPGYFNQVTTNESGFYTDSIPYASIATQGLIMVYTYDCNGSIISASAAFYPGVQQIVLDFNICGDSSSSCVSAFRFIPASNDMLTFSFIDESSTAPGASIDNWFWDFGDGNTSTEQNPTHTYSEQGLYNICLYISSNDSACSSSFCMPVEAGFIMPDSCVNFFSYYPDSAGALTFEGWALNVQTDAWTWDFGDGTTGSGQVVTHLYTDPNTIYHVCLTTNGTNGDSLQCTAISCQDVFIYIPSPCENYFEAISNDGSTFNFTGYLLSGAEADYFWDFGDGSSANGQQVSHTFQNADFPYNVCLTTVAGAPLNDSCVATTCQLIFTGGGNPGCEAIMSATSDSTGYVYYFADLTPGEHNFRMWDFGDGMQSTEANPVHMYASPGIYIACLTIGDSLSNCWDQTCQEIWVDLIQPGCEASFMAFPADSLPSSLNYQFINTSAPGYTSQLWSFGDGLSSTEANPMHTYATEGVYTVCLTIHDSTGMCQSSYCMEIYAGEMPGNNSLSGIVLAGNIPASEGIVLLIGANNAYTDLTVIDSAGFYNFGGIPAGSYYLYAMLIPGSNGSIEYLPTYYTNSLTWQGATIVTTGEPNAWYPISLVSYTNWNQGDASITGSINWAGSFKSGGTPAADVEIVLFNSSGQPVACTFSDNEGMFAFHNLPLGEYTVHAEMTGKNTETTMITLIEGAANANVSFVVSSTEIYALGTSEPELPGLQAGNPYPNPAGETLYLDVMNPVSANAIVEILDLQGRIVVNEKLELNNGNERINVAVGSLKKGAYILKISTEGREPIQRKFVK